MSVLITNALHFFFFPRSCLDHDKQHFFLYWVKIGFPNKGFAVNLGIEGRRAQGEQMKWVRVGEAEKQSGNTATGPLQWLAGWLGVCRHRLGSASWAGTICYPGGWVKTSPQTEKLEYSARLAFGGGKVGDSEHHRLNYPGGSLHSSRQRHLYDKPIDSTQGRYGEGRRHSYDWHECTQFQFLPTSPGYKSLYFVQRF